MSTILVAMVLCSAEAVAAGQQPDRSAQRPYHEINEQLRALLRAESRAASETERADAIQEMAQLYLELKRDPRLESAPTLRRYQAMLWSRLTRIKKELERSLSRTGNSSGPDNANDSQQVPDPQTSQATAEVLASQLSLVSYSLGGPGRVFAQTDSGRFAGSAAANAAELIALIQRVIAPESWDVHGGTGTIIYYAPLHVLVIRASSQVHDRIGGALGGLRKVRP